MSVEERCDTVLLATIDPTEVELILHELDRFDIYVRTATYEDLERKMETLQEEPGALALPARVLRIIFH